MSLEVTPLYPVWTDTLPLHNFMLQDVLGSLLAVLAFAAVLYAPGYLLASATNLFNFRQMGFANRSIWAVACSFSVVPVTAYLAARVAGLTGLCWLLAASALAALLLLLLRSGSLAWSRRERRITLLLISVWVLFVFLMLIEVQVGSKLYFSVVMADQSYRIAFTDAVARTGVPPANPLYFAGATASMRYYYFWYVLCAAVVKLAHVSARQSFIASSIWAGLGLLATVRLYTGHFFRWERPKRWLALGLLLITGADLIPALSNPIVQNSLNGDTEWWSVDPIDGWPDSLLWVPHHVASVLCCLLAFLFIWRTREALTRSSKAWAAALAACAFASAFGLSVYVAFGFALLMLAWLVRLAVQRHPERFVLGRRVAAVGVLSTVLLIPFLRELSGSLAYTPPTTPNAPSAHLFSLSVRRMIDSGLLTGQPVFATINSSHPILLDQAIRLLLLLPGLAMELGVYAAVLVLLLLAKRRHLLPDSEARETAIFFTLTGLVMTLFLSSSIISNNDFGYRAVMLPQFFLLLLAADVLGSWWQPSQQYVVPVTPARRRTVYTLLGLGAAGTLYWAFLLRAWLPIEATRMQNGFSQLPADNYEIREAFAKLNRTAPANAVVAFRSIPAEVHINDEVMTPYEFYQRMLVMDTGRQLLNAEYKCATHFGGDPAPCTAIQQETDKLYASPSPDSDWARNYCSRFGVQYLVISHRDPNWNSPTGWPVTLPPKAHQSGFRVLTCR